MATFTVEDLVSIAFSAVDLAIRKYDPNRNKSFYSYWQRIANNAMKRFVKNAFKANKANSSVSLDDETEVGSTLHDYLPSEDIDKEISIYNSLISIINDERCKLSLKEKQTITLSLDGYDFNEISMILNCTNKSIYRYYHSAINKIRHSLIDKK